MYKLLPIAFGALVSVALVTMDFVQQKQAATEGAFGVTAYLASVQSRYSEYKTTFGKGKGEGIAATLPAPEGWARRAMTQADRQTLFGGSAPEQTPGDLTVYQKGNALVAIHTRFTPGARDGIALTADGSIAKPARKAETLHERVLFGSVAGLDFIERLDPLLTSRQISARLREEIEITVRAQATSADIFEVISGFDVAGMNQLLTRPLLKLATPEAVTRLNAPAQEAAPEAGFAQGLAELAALEADLAQDATPQGGGIGGFFKSIFSGGDAPEEAQAALSDVNKANMTRKVTCETNHLGKRCVISYEEEAAE